MIREQRDQAYAVQRMQDYVEGHLDTFITLEQLAAAAGYSPWHATRVFKQLVGMAPSDYVRARRLSRAALRLRDAPERVLDVALGAGFDSHDGFTRAFSDRFGMTPSQYRQETPPLGLFMPRSARDLYNFHNYKTEGANDMAQETAVATVFVQVVDRPARKLILLRGREATEYFGYCEEVGCDVWGVLCSMKGALYEAAGFWLPESLRLPHTSTYVLGVEMPADYSGPVPDGMDMIDLAPCTYLVFHGQPYEPDKLGESSGAVYRAFETYKPEIYGWQWAAGDAPRFQLAPEPERGYIEGRPVREWRG
jgi:AraC-like DNA-binding protein